MRRRGRRRRASSSTRRRRTPAGDSIAPAPSRRTPARARRAHRDRTRRPVRQPHEQTEHPADRPMPLHRKRAPHQRMRRRDDHHLRQAKIGATHAVCLALRHLPQSVARHPKQHRRAIRRTRALGRRHLPPAAPLAVHLPQRADHRPRPRRSIPRARLRPHGLNAY